MKQEVLTATSDYRELKDWLTRNNIRKFLLVCDNSLQFLRIKHFMDELTEHTGIEIVKFDKFQPNPLYESVVEGVRLLRKENCQAIIAVGGGSAIDVAKCIKLYSNMELDDGTEQKNYLMQTIIPNDMLLLAVPTTAGTGSEATRYAVIYYKDVKQSVTDYSIIPSTVLLDSSALKSLPIYQKKSTMMDALCHSIESFWSVNSTEESKVYSRAALQSILKNMKGYLDNDDVANEEMLIAANTAGRAINITQTTAGHAMCYKLSSIYGIAHGHAAAMVDVKLFPWMIDHTDKCIDPRGERYLIDIFNEIASAMGCQNAKEAAEKLQNIYDGLELRKPEPEDNDFDILKTSVNPVRLKNNPVSLDTESINMIYHSILA